jgi:uncharacterized protein (DUF58 family)
MKDWPFDEDFLRRIRGLRFLRLPAARRGWEEAGRGTRSGGFLEFEEHRRYCPGDDPRTLDWNVTARTGRAHVKRFRREDEGAVAILVDASASMDRGEPNKFDVARRLAAALALVTLAGGARLRIGVAADGGCRWWRPLRGTPGFPEALRSLAAMRIAARCRLGDALRSGFSAFRDPSRLFVLSDLLERPDARRSLRAVRAAGSEPVLVQILSPQEIEPPLRGAVRVRDCESGEERDVFLDPERQVAYRDGLERLLESWRQFAARHSMEHFFVPAGANLVDFVVRELRQRRVLD